MLHSELWLAHAVHYVSKFNLSVIPMGENKKPAIKWSELQNRRPAVKEILSWPKENLAIVTGAISNLVVVDCESPEDAKWFWDQRGKSPTICKTKRGYHFYFRHPGERVANGQKIDSRYDVRGDGGYVLAPPSKHSEGQYSWKRPLIDPAKLPVFKMEWRPGTVFNSEKLITDGVSYISKIYAVSGNSGHNDTFRAAAVLKDSGLSEAEALMAMQAWNKTNATPPWNDNELLHKIRSVYS